MVESYTGSSRWWLHTFENDSGAELVHVEVFKVGELIRAHMNLKSLVLLLIVFLDFLFVAGELE